MVSFSNAGAAQPADPHRGIIERRRRVIRVPLENDQVDDLRHREADEFVLEDRPAGERDRDVGLSRLPFDVMSLIGNG